MVELERVSDSLSVKGQPGRGKWENGYHFQFSAFSTPSLFFRSSSHASFSQPTPCPLFFLVQFPIFGSLECWQAIGQTRLKGLFKNTVKDWFKKDTVKEFRSIIIFILLLGFENVFFPSPMLFSFSLLSSNLYISLSFFPAIHSMKVWKFIPSLDLLGTGTG